MKRGYDGIFSIKPATRDNEVALSIFELSHFLSPTVDSAYFVKSTPLRAFSVSYHYFAYTVDILKMCMKILDAVNLFLTNNSVLN